MKWTFSGIEAQNLLGNDPEACLLDPVLVKENPVRKVFKCGKFFVKQDFRFFNGLKSEFRHAMQLEKHHVPCVKHLAVSRNMLITLAEENKRLAEVNLDLNTYSYNQGSLTILDVLSAQLTWIQAYTNLIQKHYEQKVFMADYRKVAGLRYQPSDF